MPTLAKRTAPKPSDNLMRLCAASLAARATANTLRPIVEAHDRQALNEREYRRARRFVEQGLPDERITDPAIAYEIEPADFEGFYARVIELNRAAGLRFEQDKCPLLTAEHIQFTAENEFMKATGELGLPLCFEDLLTTEHRKTFLELSLKFVVPQVPQAMFDYYTNLMKLA